MEGSHNRIHTVDSRNRHRLHIRTVRQLKNPQDRQLSHLEMHFHHHKKVFYHNHSQVYGNPVVDTVDFANRLDAKRNLPVRYALSYAVQNGRVRKELTIHVLIQFFDFRYNLTTADIFLHHRK